MARRAADSDRIEWLSPLDMSNLRVEDHGAPMHVAAIAVVDGAWLAQESEMPRIDGIRAELARRLDSAPRLRQVISQSRISPRRPYWADYPAFDIANHVRERAIPAPGDEPAMLAVCAELNERPLDRSRPLWELWLLPGLRDGNVGLLIRLHHAAADGMAALAMFGSLLDGRGSPSAKPTAAQVPVPPPRPRAIKAEGFRRRAPAIGAHPTLRSPCQAAHRLGAFTTAAVRLAREGTAPRLSVNRQVGAHRALLLVHADLAAARRAAHLHGATVNDVVLAAVSGGARSLLADRGELRAGMTLKASVPVSARRGGEVTDAGNEVGIMLAPLPVSEPDPARRLRAIAAATAHRKRQPPYQLATPAAPGCLVPVMSRQRFVNIFTSNLHGPASQVQLAGLRVLELFQVGVVQGNVSIAVGALSYAGQLNFTIVCDADLVPDLAVFGQGLAESLAQLGVGQRGPMGG